MAWTYRTGEPLVARGRRRSPAGVRGDGGLLRGPPLREHAVRKGGRARAGDGQGALVVRQPDRPRTAAIGDFANRGVVTWRDAAKDAKGPCRQRIFFASVDARLFALDAAHGRSLRDFGTKGMIDLKLGLRRAPEYAGEYEETSPPAVIDDLVDRGLGHRRQPPRRRADAARCGRSTRARGALALDLGTRCPPNPEGAGGERLVAHRRSIRSAIWSSCPRAAPAPTTTVACGPATTATPTPSSRCAARPGDGVALPDRASRSLGLRRGVAARALHAEARRRAVPARRGRIEDGPPVPARPRDRRAALPRRGAAGAGERRAGRRGGAHAALPEPAAAARSAAADRRRRLGRDATPTASGAASRSPACAPRASSRRPACAARSSCPATSAGCTGAASPSRASRAC